MKIIVFTSIYPIKGTKVGFTPIVKYFCEDWIKQGHEVYVVNSASKFPLIFHLIPRFLIKILENKLGFNFPNIISRKLIKTKENGVNIFQLPIDKIYPGMKVSAKVIEKNIKILEKDFLKDFKPDIAIGHWVNPQIQYLSYIKDKYGISTTLTLHSVPNKLELELLKSNLNNIDNLAFRNTNIYKDTCSILDLSNKHKFLCYSGVKDYFNLSIKNFISKPIDKNNIRICFVGNLIERKHPEIILKAVNEIENINFCIDYIGTGQMEHEILNIPLKNHVKLNLLGRLDRKDVYAYLQKSDLFVMLSKDEVFGLVYLEAMLNRSIPIASYNEGFDGIIVNGQNGFLGNAGSYLDLKKIIENYIFMDEKGIIQMQESAFLTACNMTDDKMAIQYLENITN